MMNLRIALSGIYFLSQMVFLSAQNKSIIFQKTTFADIKKKAQVENKLIFVDAFTTWCGPCKYMAKNIFTNDTVADFYNTNFVNAKIDMEKGEGIELAKLYEVNCYPNLLFIDGNGKLVHRIAGAMPAQSFIELGKTALSGKETYLDYQSKYNADKNNTTNLFNYIRAMSMSCMEAEPQVKQYFSMQKDEDLLSDQNWQMIQEHTGDLQSREFLYVMNNRRAFEEKYTSKVVSDKINNVHYATLMSQIRSKSFDEKKYSETKEQISKQSTSETPIILFETDAALYQSKKNWKAYGDLVSENTEKYFSTNADRLNSIAWTVFENINDKSVLEKAESWAKKSVELEEGYANTDTYANLLFKNGKKEEALKAANQSIDLAKAAGLSKEDYKDTETLISKIRKSK
jgi:thioredoxin-related protein